MPSGARSSCGGSAATSAPWCCARSYLDYRTPSGEPSLQHAYAISAYAAESKTFEQAFALLDAGASREEFLVSVSRSRGPTTAYGVAALELTDAELGPGTRPIEDAAHEIRAAAERSREELPALEVSQRQRVAAMNEFRLARAAARSWSSAVRGRERVSRPRRNSSPRSTAGSTEVEGKLDGLRGEYAELDRPAPPRRRARRGRARRRAATPASAWRSYSGERAELVEEVAGEERPSPLSAAERLELGLIEERMAQLRRRDIALERLDPSPMIREALGERPERSGPGRGLERGGRRDLLLPPAPRRPLPRGRAARRRAGRRTSAARTGGRPSGAWSRCERCSTRPRRRADARSRTPASRSEARASGRALGLAVRRPSWHGEAVRGPPFMAGQPKSRSAPAGRGRGCSKRLLAREGEALRRTARANSANAADAEDALQDGCLAFLRFYEGGEEGAVAWLRLVVKRFAWQIGNQRPPPRLPQARRDASSRAS